MIRYNLECGAGHAFDSWFPGSDAFDEQTKRGLVACPVCNSTHVRKAIMSPSLSRGLVERAPRAEEAAPAPPVPVVMDERLAALRTAIGEMRAAIQRDTTDVGRSFPDEARKMHFGQVESKPIHGEASPDEVRELIEDGVGIMPVPTLPGDRN